MKHLNTYAGLGAALVIAALGVFRLIDENTMIMLVVVLICCMPNGRGSCSATREG